MKFLQLNCNAFLQNVNQNTQKVHPVFTMYEVMYLFEDILNSSHIYYLLQGFKKMPVYTKIFWPYPPPLILHITHSKLSVD